MKRKCFRPLSGYLISKYKMYDFKTNKETVSVPSRGILFPNEYIMERNKDGELGFRPLSGYLISKFFLISVSSLSVRSFRPISGYLISKFFWLLLPLFSVLVSVPSRGILFPNCVNS